MERRFAASRTIRSAAGGAGIISASAPGAEECLVVFRMVAAVFAAVVDGVAAVAVVTDRPRIAYLGV